MQKYFFLMVFMKTSELTLTNRISAIMLLILIEGL